MRDGGLWVFGYGSLVWRPAFPFEERRPACLRGFARRFWQGSTDHRGVPESPGRVVTLVPEAGAECWGIAYRVAGSARDAVLHRLDRRESGGFERHELSVHPRAPEGEALRALVYIAAEGNPNFLGPAPLAEMAAQVLRARGPSGTNVEYVLALAAALEVIGVRDAHVSELASRVAGPGPRPDAAR